MRCGWRLTPDMDVERDCVCGECGKEPVLNEDALYEAARELELERKQEESIVVAVSTT
jgi:hypothetical protein